MGANDKESLQDALERVSRLTNLEDQWQALADLVDHLVEARVRHIFEEGDLPSGWSRGWAYFGPLGFDGSMLPTTYGFMARQRRMVLEGPLEGVPREDA